MGVRVYLDTCLVIYRVEEPPSFLPLVQAAIARYPSGIFCVSPLVYLECWVGALRSPQVDLVARYEAFLDACVCLEMPTAVYRRAANLRAKHGLKTPDALHLATAQHHACAVFLTNDDRLGRVAGEMRVDALG